MERDPSLSIEEITISPQTMEKGVTELRAEEKELAKAVENLEKARAAESANNPTDLALFRSINGKLTASKALLKEIIAAITYKEAEAADGNAFDQALEATGERAAADRLDARRRAA